PSDASTDRRRGRRAVRTPLRGPDPDGRDTGGARESSRGPRPATARMSVHRTQRPTPRWPTPGARRVGCGSPRPPPRPRSTARTWEWTLRPRPFLWCLSHNLYVRRSGTAAGPDARRADWDGGGRTDLPAHRAASDPRDADGGRGRETGRAGETAGGRGDKTVPVTGVARSEPRLPMESPVLAKTI